MHPSIVVVTQEDPRKTHRPVEALRIALGLSTGGNPLSVVLLGPSRLLTTDDLDEVIDLDILEKYLPSLAQLNIPLIVPLGSQPQYKPSRNLRVTERPLHDIQTLITTSDRSIIF
jgi:hypothetical protein